MVGQQCGGSTAKTTPSLARVERAPKIQFAAGKMLPRTLRPNRNPQQKPLPHNEVSPTSLNKQR